MHTHKHAHTHTYAHTQADAHPLRTLCIFLTIMGRNSSK